MSNIKRGSSLSFGKYESIRIFAYKMLIKLFSFSDRQLITQLSSGDIYNLNSKNEDKINIQNKFYC
jgi:hypothetical protein